MRKVLTTTLVTSLVFAILIGLTGAKSALAVTWTEGASKRDPFAHEALRWVDEGVVDHIVLGEGELTTIELAAALDELGA